MTTIMMRLVSMHAKPLETALRAYYDQHQATGCKCELCQSFAASEPRGRILEDTTTITAEQLGVVRGYVKGVVVASGYMEGLESALRAFYNQHQKTGCKCEHCKIAEGRFAWMSKLGEARNPGTALIFFLVSIWHSLGWKA